MPAADSASVSPPRVERQRKKTEAPERKYATCLRIGLSPPTRGGPIPMPRGRRVASDGLAGVAIALCAAIRLVGLQRRPPPDRKALRLARDRRGAVED